MGSSFLEEIKNKAIKLNKTIVLPESHDERVLKAAEILTREKIVSVITLGNDDRVRSDAKKSDVDLTGVRVIDPSTSDKLSDFTNLYFNLRKHKGVTVEKARETVLRDLFFAAMMVKEGMADGSVAGSSASTADVMRAGIQCVGMPEGISIVSSFFLMIFPEKVYSFADCAVVPDPDVNQLADIAISTADNHRNLTGDEPRVAMLSFSTKGSAQHESVDKVIDAVKNIKDKRPDLEVDG
ncbi:MAG: phosphate acetyltransferase, partial [Ignavibacteriae bacterium]